MASRIHAFSKSINFCNILLSQIETAISPQSGLGSLRFYDMTLSFKSRWQTRAMIPNLKDNEKGFILLLSLAFIFWRQQAKFSRISLTLKKNGLCCSQPHCPFHNLAIWPSHKVTLYFSLHLSITLEVGVGDRGRPQLPGESHLSEVLNNYDIERCYLLSL